MLFLPFLAGAIPWLVGGLTTYFTAKKWIEAKGDTPKNNANAAGLTPDQHYDLWQSKLKGEQETRKKAQEIADEQNQSLAESIKKLEEQNAELVKKLEGEKDPTEKAKIISLINDNKKEIATNRKAMSANTNKVLGSVKDMHKPGTKELSDPTKMATLYQSEANKPSLSSWKNWGIIVFVVIIAIILISYLKKMLSGLVSSMK